MSNENARAALITGASSGIGRAIADRLIAHGCRVVTCDISEAHLADFRAAHPHAHAVPADVASEQDVDSIFDVVRQELGGLDILVNNAGGFDFMSPIVDVRPEGWNKIVDLNLSSVFHATQFAARHMVESGRGSIINIASAAGIQGFPTVSYYSAAKGGVIMLTQATAKELASANVRVNAIAPGFMVTQMTEAVTSDAGMLKLLEDRIPMKRFGRAEEVVGTAIFLASDAGSYVTGATVVVDGGATA